MADIRSRLVGGDSVGHAERVKPEEIVESGSVELDDKDGADGQKRKEDIGFLPIPRNREFFDGEARGFSMMYYAGFQHAPDFSRLDLLFADPLLGPSKITLYGQELRALLKMIRWRKVANVREIDELQARGKPGIVVTKMVYERVRAAE